MKYLSSILACLFTCFIISCGSDDDASGSNSNIPSAAPEGQYNGADFIALYHGTPKVLASIATGGKVEMDKWNELFSLFTEAPKTRGIIGSSVALVQFAGKMTVVAKNANMDIYTRLKSMGVSYKDMYNQVEPGHRGYDNAEEWEIAMNQGKITNPYCFSDLATAYALKLEDGPGYNYYRYKILANTSVELAEEGVNVIASFDSDISNAKTAYDFVNSVGNRDYETFSSKVSGIINGTGGDISDAALYAYKTYLDYCLANRETSFSWLPKNNQYFGDNWYEKIDDKTEYEFSIYGDNMTNENVTRKKWENGKDEALSYKNIVLTLYCGKENYILYLNENNKVVPYRIINTAGDYVTSEDAFFYMIEVGGTKKRLWRRRPYYSHEKEEVPENPVKVQDKIIGTWENTFPGTSILQSTVTFNADYTWSAKQYKLNGGSPYLWTTASGKWEAPMTTGANNFIYTLKISNAARNNNPPKEILTSYIASHSSGYNTAYMGVRFDSDNKFTVKDKVNTGMAEADHPSSSANIWMPFVFDDESYTKK